jgi:hypothetical protein
MGRKVANIIKIAISKERLILFLAGQRQFSIVVPFIVNGADLLPLHAPDSSCYLGRPWRPYAKTVFIGCFLDKLINPKGWHNWDNAENEKTAYYSEYNNYGLGADTLRRVSWSHQLFREQAKEYTLGEIFGDWIPAL